MMAAMFNQIIMAGNMTRDPELNHTTNGTPVSNFRIASSERVSKDNERVTFIDCAAFGKLAELVMQFAGTGTNVLISGRLDEDGWVDKDGNKRFKHYITVNTFRVLGAFKNSNEPKPELF